MGSSHRLAVSASIAFFAVGMPALSVRAASPPPQTEPIVVRVDSGGFHWGDAGIGATAGFGAALVLAGSLALAGHANRREKSNE